MKRVILHECVQCLGFIGSDRKSLNTIEEFSPFWEKWDIPLRWCIKSILSPPTSPFPHTFLHMSPVWKLVLLWVCVKQIFINFLFGLSFFQNWLGLLGLCALHYILHTMYSHLYNKNLSHVSVINSSGLIALLFFYARRPFGILMLAKRWS